jgi:uncharacterized protein
MKRLIESYIKKDISRKIILLSGPRQVGKTTLSKMISDDFDYFNYDLASDRVALIEKSWNRKKDLVIFDELHKMKNWKSWIKGVYDTEKRPPHFLVTGSARLDTIRKVGDSLAGRFFRFRLHPVDVKEALSVCDPAEALERIIRTGGFPEPFIENDSVFYKRWKKTHLDIILRQDLIDLESVSDIKSIETLIELLRKRVGSPVSYTNLSNDLQKDPKTIKRWLTILENLFVVFPVTPWHDNIARAILKEPKYYFFDTGQVIGDEGVVFENAVACALLKEIHFKEDVFGTEGRLHFIKDKEKREIDFAIYQDGKITHLIETKLSDDNFSRSFFAFEKYFEDIKKIQLVKNISREKTSMSGIEVLNAAEYLAHFEL